MEQTALMDRLNLFEVKPGLRFSVATLRQILPDVETTLFFGKLYDLKAHQLGSLLSVVHNTSVIQALTAQGVAHSNELQDYCLELGYGTQLELGEISFDNTPPPAEILPELWKSLEVEVAKSIRDVAEKLKGVVGTMPGKQGEMVFKSMMMVNAKRPIIGDYKASIHHGRQPDNLVILDVSGSMTEETVRVLVDDVVALAYMANAHLAIVSDTATHWGPGEFSTEVVLKAAEYAGTHYEQLEGLFNQDWGVVVTIADYDSSYAAKGAIARTTGSIEQLLDISLVNRPTFLSEVLGQKAKEVKPLLVAADNYCCMY